MKNTLVKCLNLLIVIMLLSTSGCKNKDEVENSPTPYITPLKTAEPTSSPTPVPREIYDGPDFGKKAEIEVDGHQMDPTERPKELMVDEDPDTRWAFKLFPTDVIVDFGAPFVLSKIIFTWLNLEREYYYEVYASVDNKNWELVVDRSQDSEPYTTVDDLKGVYARYLCITLIDNSDQNGWAAINEVDIEGFRFGDSDYDVDLENKRIKVSEPCDVDTFIKNCKLGGLYEASVLTDEDKIKDGDVLVVKCGDVNFEYVIVVN
jgi:hypothetical protein